MLNPSKISKSTGLIYLFASVFAQWNNHSRIYNINWKMKLSAAKITIAICSIAMIDLIASTFIIVSADESIHRVEFQNLTQNISQILRNESFFMDKGQCLNESADYIPTE